MSEQQKQAGRSPAVGVPDQQLELSKLRADLERKAVFCEEELSRRDNQHNNELKALKKELRDAEAQQLSFQKEIMMLKDKLEKTRRERYRSASLQRKMNRFHIVFTLSESKMVITDHWNKNIWSFFFLIYTTIYIVYTIY